MGSQPSSFARWTSRYARAVSVVVGATKRSNGQNPLFQKTSGLLLPASFRHLGCVTRASERYRTESCVTQIVVSSCDLLQTQTCRSVSHQSRLTTEISFSTYS